MYGGIGGGGYRRRRVRRVSPLTDPWEGVLLEKDPWKYASWEGELWGSETASVPSPSSEVVSLPSASSMPDLEDLDISGLATPPRMFGDFHVSVS